MRVSSLAVAGGLVLLGLAAGVSALFIPLGPEGGWGARLFPLMASGALFLCGAGAIAGRSDDTLELATASGRAVLSLAVLAVVYVWLMGRVGYLISTAAVVPPALWLFGIRRPLPLLCAAVGFALALHFLFFRALGVFPPVGRWFDLLDLIPVL